MVANPCFCGCSLQLGTKILAILDMLVAIALLAVSGILLVGAIALLTDKSDEHEDGTVAVLLAAAIISILIHVAQLILAIVLLQGASARNLSKCRVWFIISMILLGLTVVDFIYELASAAQTPEYVVYTSLLILYHLYALLVVFAFMDELRGSPVPTNAY